MLGRGNLDDPNYQDQDFLPRARGLNLGSPALPWNNVYVEGSIIGATFDLANNQWLQSLNAAGSAFLKLLKADTSNNTVLNAATGKSIIFQVNEVTALSFNGTTFTPASSGALNLGTNSLPFGNVYTQQLLGSGVTLLIGTTTAHSIRFSTNNNNRWQILSSGGHLSQDTAGGDIIFNNLGNTLFIKAGVNGKAGTVTVNGATPVTVNTTAVTANSVILFSLKTVGGSVGAIPHAATVTPATGFTVVATAGDTSVYNWAIIELS